MIILAKKVVKFKPGKALSDAAASVKKTNAAKSAKPKQTEKRNNTIGCVLIGGTQGIIKGGHFSGEGF